MNKKHANPLEELHVQLEAFRKAGTIGEYTVITLDGRLLRVTRGEKAPDDLRGFLLTAMAGVINRVEVA